jgi:hypothetical protein
MSEQTHQIKTYEAAIDAFEEADGNYKMLEKALLEGAFIPNMLVDGVALKQQYLGLVQDLRDALEERNALLKNVKDELRKQLALPPGTERGPDAKPAKLEVKGFKAISVTARTFDPNSLLALSSKHGLSERILELKSTDKDGKEYKLVDRKWVIDFENLHTWLKANKLDDIINGSYDEKEGTPQVRGPKPLAFLGDKVD